MQRHRVDAQPAYVLHSYPFRETSLIIEAFTRDYGRIALVARGARRPRSAIRGMLMAFQPLELGWAGKGEVPTLMKAEWQGGIALLGGQALFCAYYLNELLMHLLPREDAHERLFQEYERMLHCLSADPRGPVNERDLRSFERVLLQELGYGLTLEQDNEGRPIDPSGRYAYQVDQGPILLPRGSRERPSFGGRALLDLGKGDFTDPRSLQESKHLMRTLLAHYLAGVELETRKIFKELQEL